MIKDEYKVVGVMSGTSLDGIDLVHVIFRPGEHWTFELQHAETIPYPDHWTTILKDLVGKSIPELDSIDTDYTGYLGGIIRSYIKEQGIEDLDAVCSHGHTALHQPEHGLTLQIGNLNSIAKYAGETVVCNFRVQDVSKGGQGAPLVPIGDELLFSHYDYCLNLGGFANVSSRVGGSRIAYDICPVNIVLNYYASILGMAFDAEGRLASTGSLNQALLNKLNGLEYYQKVPPKSLGLEWVMDSVMPIMEASKLPVSDLLRTFTEHVAMQLSDAFTAGSVLITGGGTYNRFLIERLSHYFKGEIVRPSQKIIEFKEALIFGLLGVLRLRNENNCLASVTGASSDHSSGIVIQP